MLGRGKRESVIKNSTLAVCPPQATGFIEFPTSQETKCQALKAGGAGRKKSSLASGVTAWQRAWPRRSQKTLFLPPFQPRCHYCNKWTLQFLGLPLGCH